MPKVLHRGDRVLLEHRLDREALRLDDAALGPTIGGAVRDAAQELLLLDRPGANPRLLLEVDRLALHLVDDDVQGGLVRGARGGGVDRVSVDHQGDVHDVRVCSAAVRLVGELHGRIRPVIEEALEARKLAFRVLPDSLRDLEVLAPDNRPHG